MTAEGHAFNQAVKGSPETLQATWYLNGSVSDPGVTTIGIVNAYGTTILAAGTATTTPSTGVREYALTAALNANVDLLTVTWTTANFGTLTQIVEVVGRHLFTIVEARAYRPIGAGSTGTMADQTAYTQAAIERERARILDEWDRQILGYSLVPRYELVTLDGCEAWDRGRRLPLLRSDGTPAQRVRSLRSIETREPGASTWTAMSASDLALVVVTPDGDLFLEAGDYWVAANQNVRVGYEHGLTTPPVEAKGAALTLLAYLLVPSNLSSRELQQNTQFGTINLATAGRYGDWYGIPSVDSVLDRLCRRVPVAG